MRPWDGSQRFIHFTVSRLSLKCCLFMLSVGCSAVARVGNQDLLRLSLAQQPHPESLTCSVSFLLPGLENPNRGHPNLCQLCIHFPSILIVFRGIYGIPRPDRPVYIRENKMTVTRGARGSTVCACEFHRVSARALPE